MKFNFQFIYLSSMPYLTTDIVSSTNRVVYGKKGDLVSICADHDNVFIVDNNGNRFGVLKSLLSEERVEPDVQQPLKENVRKKRK